MQDTFFVEPPEAHLVLRTHTSPVQVRTMLERTPPSSWTHRGHNSIRT